MNKTPLTGLLLSTKEKVIVIAITLTPERNGQQEENNMKIIRKKIICKSYPFPVFLVSRVFPTFPFFIAKSTNLNKFRAIIRCVYKVFARG